MPPAPRQATRHSDPDSDPRLQIMSVINTPLFVFDVDQSAIHWANESAVAYWEASSAEELYQRDFLSGMSANMKLRVKQIQEICVETHQPVTEQWTIYPQGKPRHSTIQSNEFRTLDGRTLLLMHITESGAIVDDDMAYRSTALLHTSTIICAYDAELNLVYCNTAARQSLGSSVTTIGGRLANPSELSRITSALAEGDYSHSELEVNTSEGIRWHELHVQRCTNPTSGKLLYLATETDITERRRAQAEAIRLAFTDSLTGLPNRSALNRHLKELLDGQSPTPFAVLFLDLNRFKVINDSLGHAVGDQLLIDVASRLKQALGSDGQAFRIGGDEFVLVASRSTKPQQLEQICDRIRCTLSNPVTLSEHKLRVLPSIGISICPDDGDHISALMENADAAMYIAKANQCGYCFYDAKMSSSINEKVKERMGLENDMLTAIDNDEFELYFQPKISCRNLAVNGVEALIRWHHPEHGLVPPDKFIGIAEDTGQIVDLGNWVLLAAMRQQRRWHDEGLRIPVSVNISARQFSHNDLLADVSNALESTGCQPHMIELEITESMLIGDPDSVHETLQKLSAMGIRLALDDFGTGYSNLAYLQKYPLDCMKIDRLFLAERKRSLLMGTILNTARVLGLKVVAEGVETATQADWLIANGCDLMQGFYFSKPEPVSIITAYLHDHGARWPSADRAA